MATILTDPEIASLLVEPKPLPQDYLAKMVTKGKRGHRERELELTGADGSVFRVILRQSNFNVLDFSVILAHQVPESTQLIRLRRYNGKSHEHTNSLEGDKFYGFHIHEATLRYQQESGEREDGFARLTDRYADFQGALNCMLSDCGFVFPVDVQSQLF